MERAELESALDRLENAFEKREPYSGAWDDTVDIIAACRRLLKSSASRARKARRRGANKVRF